MKAAERLRFPVLLKPNVGGSGWPGWSPAPMAWPSCRSTRNRGPRRLTRAAAIDVGGVEYLVSVTDGRPYFYDVNATSNFVANAPDVLGFDPFPRFADFIVRVADGSARSLMPR